VKILLGVLKVIGLLFAVMVLCLVGVVLVIWVMAELA
jgi:hypothetical protein